MDIIFQDPSAIPLPPNEVRILKLHAEPWPDKQRVRIYLELTPFQKHPSGEITVQNPEGVELATLSIIETIDPKMEFTVHLRGPATEGENLVSATIYYLEAKEHEDADEIPDPTRKKIVVDEGETHFRL